MSQETTNTARKQQGTNLTHCSHERNENSLTGLNSLVGAKSKEEPSPIQIADQIIHTQTDRVPLI